jgi:Fe2+ transport system protein B
MKCSLLPTVEEVKARLDSACKSTPTHARLRKELRKALNRQASTSLRTRKARQTSELKERVVKQEKEIEDLKEQNRWLANQLLFSKELRSENGHLAEQLLLLSELWLTSKGGKV